MKVAFRISKRSTFSLLNNLQFTTEVGRGRFGAAAAAAVPTCTAVTQLHSQFVKQLQCIVIQLVKVHSLLLLELLNFADFSLEIGLFFISFH